MERHPPPQFVFLILAQVYGPNMRLVVSYVFNETRPDFKKNPQQIRFIVYLNQLNDR